MGMYCCCDVKIDDNWKQKCTCDWNGWVSIYDWPPPRKNRSLPFALPEKEGEYLTRYQTQCGDHIEIKQKYSKKARKSNCGYTGKELWLHWSGDYEEQPYAWRDIQKNL